MANINVTGSKLKTHLVMDHDGCQCLSKLYPLTHMNCFHINLFLEAIGSFSSPHIVSLQVAFELCTFQFISWGRFSGKIGLRWQNKCQMKSAVICVWHPKLGEFLYWKSCIIQYYHAIKKLSPLRGITVLLRNPKEKKMIGTWKFLFFTDISCVCHVILRGVFSKRLGLNMLILWF